MAVPTGRYRLGTQSGGRIVLHTYRDGLAATAGHDLLIDLPRWSGELTVDENGTVQALEARIDVGALVIREGTGGLKPLSDRDRREIATTARRLLATDRYPEAVFTATGFGSSGDSGAVEGNFSLRGQTRPLRLEVSQSAGGSYTATGTVVQSAYGIKPYTGFFGALKVRDTVDIEVADIQLEAMVPAGENGE
jgi:polyisoprenoid-binding protein YceI